MALLLCVHFSSFPKSTSLLVFSTLFTFHLFVFLEFSLGSPFHTTPLPGYLPALNIYPHQQISCLYSTCHPDSVLSSASNWLTFHQTCLSPIKYHVTWLSSLPPSHTPSSLASIYTSLPSNLSPAAHILISRLNDIPHGSSLLQTPS